MKQSKKRHDDKMEHRDPREAAGRCIPKRNLAKLLEDRGITQASFAEDMHVEPSTVANWINGKKHMPNAMVARSSWRLKVHPFYLLDVWKDLTMTTPSSLDEYQRDYRYKCKYSETMRSSLKSVVRRLENPMELMEAHKADPAPDDGMCCDMVYEQGGHAILHATGIEKHPSDELVARLWDELDEAVPGDWRDMEQFAKDAAEEIARTTGERTGAIGYLVAAMGAALASMRSE